MFRMRRLTWLALVTASGATLAVGTACSTDGQNHPAPGPAQTATCSPRLDYCQVPTRPFQIGSYQLTLNPGRMGFEYMNPGNGIQVHRPGEPEVATITTTPVQYEQFDLTATIEAVLGRYGQFRAPTQNWLQVSPTDRAVQPASLLKQTRQHDAHARVVFYTATGLKGSGVLIVIARDATFPTPHADYVASNVLVIDITGPADQNHNWPQQSLAVDLMRAITN